MNECASSPCQHNCHNTPGSYTCSCLSCYYKVGRQCELRQCRIASRCYQYGQVNAWNQCQVNIVNSYLLRPEQSSYQFVLKASENSICREDCLEVCFAVLPVPSPRRVASEIQQSKMAAKIF